MEQYIYTVYIYIVNHCVSCSALSFFCSTVQYVPPAPPPKKNSVWYQTSPTVYAGAVFAFPPCVLRFCFVPVPRLAASSCFAVGVDTQLPRVSKTGQTSDSLSEISTPMVCAVGVQYAQRDGTHQHSSSSIFCSAAAFIASLQYIPVLL